MKNKHERYTRFQSQLDLPFLETPKKSLIEIFNILEEKFNLTKNSNQKLIDLGSGNGQVVIYAALNYNIKSIGVEINQELVKEAKGRIKELGKGKLAKLKKFRKIKLIKDDFYQMNLKPFQFIYIYSLPTMHKFLKHLFITARFDAIVISYKYCLKNFENILKEVYVLDEGEGDQKLKAYFYLKF